MTDVLTPGQLMARLPWKSARFYVLQKAGTFRFLEVARPIGTARYSKALVDACVHGESVTAFGRGSRSMRRAS